ncbi:MAG: hypothetical protein B6U85_07145 [Desulfurococcales archaeon ex4484_42]|nr:MAG: hypothetical protein B6U85_07145 [Desulfurococcales archaeon ex4484_42]
MVEPNGTRPPSTGLPSTGLGAQLPSPRDSLTGNKISQLTLIRDSTPNLKVSKDLYPCREGPGKLIELVTMECLRL